MLRLVEEIISDGLQFQEDGAVAFVDSLEVILKHLKPCPKLVIGGGAGVRRRAGGSCGLLRGW